MPYPVANIIRGRSKLETVATSDTALCALQKMIKFDYSQLPVVDQERHPIGLISSDSILRSMSNFRVTIDQLHVQDALCTAKMFSPEDDLFELLGSLRDAYAVLIVDATGALIGIVTDYDTSEYFRRRAEDTMLVEDIERTLRDFVLAAFPQTQENDEDNKDSPELSVAINKVLAPDQDQSRIKQTVTEYLKLENLTPKLNTSSFDSAFDKIMSSRRKPKTFNDLSFNEIEDLLLSEERWAKYRQCFTVDKPAIRRLLDDVRNTRNKLAHFKGEVTEVEHDRLRYCVDWLQRHQNAVLNAFDKSLVVPVIGVSNIQPADQLPRLTPAVDALRHIVDEAEQSGELPSDRKYNDLSLFLQKVPMRVKEVEMSFSDIEGIISQQLPQFARQHRTWWANDPETHLHAQAWLDAGWRVASINLNEEKVKFSRLATRSRAFIDFFSKLTEELRGRPDFGVRESSPTGECWHVVKVLSGGKCRIITNFGLRQKFRVELYIDCGDKIKNKVFFDALHLHKDQIEQTFGHPLSWERLDDKKAARVAYYVDGAITDTPTEMERLKKQSAQLTVTFLACIRELVDRTKWDG